MCKNILIYLNFCHIKLQVPGSMQLINKIIEIEYNITIILAVTLTLFNNKLVRDVLFKNHSTAFYSYVLLSFDGKTVGNVDCYSLYMIMAINIFIIDHE